MKKFISIILCLAMLIGTVAVSTHAQQGEITWDGDPVVFIQGYTGSALVKDRGLETEAAVWGAGRELDIAKIIISVPGILAGIVLHAMGDSSLLLSSFGALAEDMLGGIEILEDGTSKYNVTPYPYYAEEASIATLRANGKEDYVPEKDITNSILETVPAEYVFIFNTDWRLGQIDNSEMLAAFIDGVLECTGKDKVDIYALSHGGQTAAAYLYYYGTQAKVDNAVLNVPAIGGTTIATGLLGGNINFGMDEISRFLAVMLRTETDLRFLGKILPGDFLNGLINTVFSEMFLPVALNFGSVWDFMDIDTYTTYKAKYLNNPIIHGERIEKHDKMHYDCMANMSKGLKAAQAAGVNIYITANYGTQLGTGETVDSDFIIDTKNTTGAYTADYGTHFVKGYTAKGTNCSDPTHNHVSPSYTVDASTAFLPENTWFIYGQYHGQVYWDDYTRPMIMEMLLTDNIKDVHSDPRYPQFELAQCPVDGVYAKFTNEKSGYYNANSKQLLIRNICDENSMVITAIKADGCEFNLDSKKVLAPDEEMTVDCSKLSDNGCFIMEIEYKYSGSLLAQPMSRTLYFCKN